MNARNRWSTVLIIIGLFVILAGAIDPLEGSFIIVPGIGVIAMGMLLCKSRYRKLLYLSFVLAAFGVAAMVVLSMLGGIGGQSGHSMWWGLFILPYPAGWIMAIAGIILRFIEHRKSLTQ